jgi:hypothetical protein
MRIILSGDETREDLPVAGDQRRCSIVTGGFEAEDKRHFRRPLQQHGALG